MLIVSIAALVAFGLVMARAIFFACRTTDRRQADNAEVAYILMNSILYTAAYIVLWRWEPEKLINNSIPSVMFVMFTIVSAAYFYRRIGALIDGRNRRRTERRHNPEQDRRAPE
jgi:cbb3-type cytochrome oxidase subunit 3